MNLDPADYRFIQPPDKDGNEVEGTIALRGGKNTADHRILGHLEINIRRQLPQFKGYQVQRGVKLVLACGGPSLKTNMRGLKKAIERGGRLVTYNNTHEYMQDEGLVPKIHVMIDARPFNKRFVARPVPGCRYLIASQVHPSVFEALEGYDVTIFHVDIDMKDDATNGQRKLLDDFYDKRWNLLAGGTTVTTVSLTMLVSLGFQWFDIYGFDSCYLGGKHHSYDQPENDLECHKVIFPHGIKPKIFHCAQWMIRQAYDFEMWTKMMPPDKYHLRVHGPGLIAKMIETGGSMPPKTEIEPTTA